ncbi:hypothetical protein HK101_001367 [Irineochytrium annulatum]|nr:hypothetical protein HK101_001367 [Irineochytrium annulatum]
MPPTPSSSSADGDAALRLTWASDCATGHAIVADALTWKGDTMALYGPGETNKFEKELMVAFVTFEGAGPDRIVLRLVGDEDNVAPYVFERVLGARVESKAADRSVVSIRHLERRAEEVGGIVERLFEFL